MTAANDIELIQIPAAELKPSKRNARKSTPTKESDEELLAGIRAVGVLHPPIVIATEDGYEVIAGKRRLKAVQQLIKIGELPETTKLTCRLIDGDNAEEISVIENRQREAMHPADEFEAFRTLQRKGSKEEDIAKHFGITIKEVQKRLKLGRLAPIIRKAFRKGEIGHDAVQAFTIEEDANRQIEVFNRLKAENNLYAYQIRETLATGYESSESRLGKFVGVNAYEKAGGSVSHDLFLEQIYLHDTALLKELAMAKLEKAAKKLSADWNWTEIAIDAPQHNLKRLTAIDTEDTQKCREKVALIQKKINTLHQTIDDDDWTDKHEAQSDRLYEQLDKAHNAIPESRAYKAEEAELAGCIVSVGQDGELKIERGLVRRGEETALAELQGGKKKGSKSSKGSTPAVESDQLSQALRSDLATYRLNIIKAHLASNLAAAQNLLYYTLCANHFIETYYDKPAAIGSEPTNPAHQLTREDNGPAVAMLQKIRDELPLEWIHKPSEEERFRAFSALDQNDKDRLVSYCVATAVKTRNLDQEGYPAVEITAAGLQIPWHKQFLPEVDNYFGRISKGLLIQHGELFLDAEWKAEAEKRTKKQLAEDMAGVFNGEDQTMSDEARAKAIDWTPDGFCNRAEPLA